MIEKELQEYIREIRGMVPDSTWSDDALLALGACCVSLQNLVVSCGLEGEYGSRKEYERMLDRLCDIIRERCESLETAQHPGSLSGENGAGPLHDDKAFTRRSRLTVGLYELLHRPMRVAELSRVKDCRERMCRLVGEWMERLSEGMPCEASALSAEYDVLRCIAYLLCYESEEVREKDNAWKYFRGRLAEWSESLDENDQWEMRQTGLAASENHSEETAIQPRPGGTISQSQSEAILQGLSDGDALQRLSLLSLNANLFGDNRLDSLVTEACAACCRRLLPAFRNAVMEASSSAGIVPPLLYQLYDLTMWGPGMPDARTIDAIAGLARQIIDDVALSESRLWGLAILTDLACRRVSAALETEYFACA